MKVENSDRMKVLVITYDYYPDQSPNTYRWKNVLEKWAERGVEIFVIAAQKDDLKELEKVNGINIYRTGKTWIENAKAKILKKNTAKNTITHENNSTIAKEGWVRKIYNLTWKKLYFPDFAFLWRTPSKKLAQKLIESENIYNVITVSWPFTDHVVGYNLKKKYKINWIADTIDPFYLSKAVNNQFLYSKLNRSYEHRILKRADSLTVLTEKLKEQYSFFYPLDINKIIVNHNIFIPYPAIASKKSESDKIKIVYVGTLAPVTRSPEVALSLFKNILKCSPNVNIELHFYGDASQCLTIFNPYGHLINSKIFINGLVPRDAIPEILSQADVLLNIGNTNEFQEPSKLIEYIYIGKPVLNICSIENDSSKELLKNYPSTFNIHKNEIDDQEILKKCIEFIMKKETVGKNLVSEIIKEYLLDEV